MHGASLAASVVELEQLAARVTDFAVALEEVADQRRRNSPADQHQRREDQQHDDDRDRSGHDVTLVAIGYAGRYATASISTWPDAGSSRTAIVDRAGR
jgi:hypothetical protein